MMFFKKIARKLSRKLLIQLGLQLQKVDAEIARITLPKFAKKSENLRIDLPRNIVNPDRIFPGNDIWLGPGTLLIAMATHPGPALRHPNKKQSSQSFSSKIYIGNRVTSTSRLQIAAHKEVIIEDDVLFASNVNLTDGLHGYAHANEPYKYQDIFNIAPIVIKRGSWIGQNVVVMPGVTIGELSIIGANSVVTKSVPDRCIAVGNPARVIKRWEESTQCWRPEVNINDRGKIMK